MSIADYGITTNIVLAADTAHSLNMSPKSDDWLEGVVAQRIEWTERLISLKIAVDYPAFRAGQFTRVALDLDGERVARPYSFVNAPHEGLTEIYFTIVSDGPLSPRLAALQPGATLWLHRRASGLMTLDDIPPATDLWLLSTGTGLGPYLSILKTQAPWQRYERIVLAHGVRSTADLTHRETINEAQAKHPGQLVYLPYTSREQTAFTLHGRIPGSIEDGRLEGQAGRAISPDRSHVMLCGNSGMIADATRILEQRGLRRHLRREPGQITTEKYH